MNSTSREIVEIDHSNLRKMLRTLIQDLSVPYLERRARSNAHKSSPIEELSDAIEELSQREREFKASAGIATLLLENNEILQENNEKSQTIIDKKREKIMIYKEKLANTRREMSENLEAHDQTKIKLFNAQEHIIKITNDNEMLTEQINLFKNIPETHNESLIKYKAKIDLLNQEITKQNTEMVELIDKLKNELSEEKTQNADFKQKLSQKKQVKSDLKAEVDALTKRLQRTEKSLSKALETIKKLEINNEKLLETNDNYRDNLFRVEAKLKTVEIIKSIINKNELSPVYAEYDEQTTQEGWSLKSELQEIDELSFKEPFAAIELQKDLKILPSYRRKSPSEEYFHLVSSI